MARYTVPQFTEIEGRIAPFLTFRQFFWLAGGGAVCLLFYYTLPSIVFVILSLLAVFIVAISAFVKINNEVLAKTIIKAIIFSFGKKTYTWKRRGVDNYIETKKEPMLKEIVKEIRERPESSLVVKRSKLKEIKRQVETKR